jgi:hypothetical protein
MDSPLLYTEKLKLLRDMQATLVKFRGQFVLLEKNEARFVGSSPEELGGILTQLDALEAEVDALTEAVEPLAFFER